MRIIAVRGKWVAVQKSWGESAKFYATNLSTGAKAEATDSNDAITKAGQMNAKEQSAS